MTEKLIPLADWHARRAVLCNAMGDHGLAEFHKKAAALIRQQHAALVRADMFITNGIDVGAIRMPDEGLPDAAHETPGIIRAAIQAAKGQP